MKQNFSLRNLEIAQALIYACFEKPTADLEEIKRLTFQYAASTIQDLQETEIDFVLDSSARNILGFYELMSSQLEGE